MIFIQCFIIILYNCNKKFKKKKNTSFYGLINYLFLDLIMLEFIV